ncbi:thimanine synthesis protein ThiJ [Halobellus salinus]|uniref:Thimanine synthesis protein ThiJ n=1 Tax=Halobellus salinus TaxID=931585 RepID=A0A830EI19_9EURY|nr:DJ-1/PfpI family protein [Halobellus salinus]GGJ12480.1 thimanine synthesis protein ThiJ [Halobellus salinus]SMP28985.1 DJ-1/PfpI family protein [Halobellus salinus]
MRVHIPIFDGFDELDAVGPYEVFRTAAQVGADCHVSLVTLTDREVVTAAKGLSVVPDGVLPSPDVGDTPDLLVVPGGGWNDGDGDGDGDGDVRREVEAGDLPAAIRAHREAGTEVASVCTGAMLLERAGVLEGRPAVTHRGATDDLRAAGVEVRDNRVVDAGAVVTAGGITSGIDLALHLLDRGFGGNIAGTVAEELAHDRSDDVAVVG